MGSSRVWKATYFAPPMGSDPVEQPSQREPDPRDHHRPSLDAPHPVHSLLQRAEPEHLVEVKHLRLVDHPFDGDGPRPRHEPGRRGRDALLVGRELVEVVVVADLLEGRHRLVGAEPLATSPGVAGAIGGPGWPRSRSPPIPARFRRR